MGISKENLVDLQEKYERVRKLIKEDSKLDPESEPYKSKYNGRELLLEMDMNAENLIRSCQNTDENWEKLIGKYIETYNSSNDMFTTQVRI